MSINVKQYTKKVYHFIVEVISNWSNDNVSTYAASVAYFSIFSLAPLIIIFTAITGLVLGHDAAEKQIFDNINLLIGPENAQQIKTMITSASKPSRGFTAEILGFVVLLIGASGVFSQIQLALNKIWDVHTEEKAKFFKFIKDRFLSFALVLGVGFLLLVSLAFSVVLTAVSTFVSSTLGFEIIIAWIINIIISLFGITLLFALIFKVLPDVDLNWRDVLLGAFITAILFNLGKSLLGLYLGSSHVANAFGPAGSLIIILIWLYYSSQILFIGAEITKNQFKKEHKMPKKKITKK